MAIKPGKLGKTGGDEDFPQPLGTGDALISDVAPILKRERAPREQQFPFGFTAAPVYAPMHNAPAHSRHRGSVRSGR